MGDHIVDGEFQSDKYPDCPRGKVPLSVKDVTAQDLLWIYAQRRRAVDAGFSEDLETCLLAAGFGPIPHTEAPHTPHGSKGPAMQQVVTAAFMAGVEYGEGWIDEAPDAEAEALVYAQRVTSDLGPLADMMRNLARAAAQIEHDFGRIEDEEIRSALKQARELGLVPPGVLELYPDP